MSAATPGGDSMECIRWFHEICKEHLSLVGGKNASLGELMRAGIPVPPGFALTTQAFDRFLKEAAIRGEITSILGRMDPLDNESLEASSRSIRSIIEASPISVEMEDDIGEAYRRLSRMCQVPALPVAVRSSATSEDLPDASFAGQQDTFLWIRGMDDLLLHVKRCWSSLYGPRALAYRARMGYAHEAVSISVGIQKMVNSWNAGVMFTLDPANGDPSRIVIDANWGFGESVVSGECTPDHFVVDKITMQIVSRTISRKHCYFTTDPETQRVQKVPIPEERQENQCMLDEDVLRLARIGKAVEAHYGRPMDIEWAIDKDLMAPGNVLILQSRPETVWSRKKSAAVIGKKTGLELLMERAMKPFRVGD